VIAGAPLAPDGLEALAALITLRGLPAEALLAPPLAAALATRPGGLAAEKESDSSGVPSSTGPASAAERRGNPPDSLPFSAAEALQRLTRVVARRAALAPADAPQPSEGERTPVARFLRRQARRWRIAQAPVAPLPPQGLTAEGLTELLRQTPDPGRRRDVLALAPAALAHAVGHTRP
jgi:hypothetical protein